jgi:FtsP/CotA-like multicopper oxidase with cupredoxin domain
MKSQTKAYEQSKKSEVEPASRSVGSVRSDSLGSRKDRNKSWTRRAFIMGTAMTGCSLLATRRVAAQSSIPQEGVADGRQDRGPRYPLQVPTETPASLGLLTCAPAFVNLGDGKLRAVLAYNGRFPGPTWIARTGDQIIVTLQNGLSEETITHWHGMAVDYWNDGGPRLAIGPGQSYNYNFPIRQRAGLNFYHPHPHMLTGKQVCLGLAGAFIIRDAEEDALQLPAGAYEVPLIIRDASFSNKGDLAYNPTMAGFNGKFPLVNGTLRPMLNVDQGWYRFRVLNGANARVFRLALSNGAPFTVIGNDGGLLRSPATVSEMELGMGERVDLLVNFSALGGGQSVTLRCLNARWDLIQFVGTGAPGFSYSPPATLSTIQALVGPSQPTRIFSFDGMSRINGQQYDLYRIDFQVPFGVTERWRFKTGGNAPHTVHVHGASFQVVSRTGGRARLFDWEGGWKDTVLLNDRETCDVQIRFDGYRGLYVIHCHQLEHEDMGMMSNFEVV